MKKGVFLLNKVYKLVWSKVRNCYMVVSELAKSYSKNKSMRSSVRRGAFLMLLGMLPMGMVPAATPVTPSQTHYYSVESSLTGAGSNYNNDGAKGENALAAGSNASAQKESVAIGYMAQAQDERSVVIGKEAKTVNTTDGGSVAIGFGSQAGQKVNSGSSGLATAVGMNAKAIGWGSSAYGVVAEAQDAWSTAIGNQAKAKGVGGTAIGDSAKTGAAYATAVGLGAEAMGRNALAAGLQAKANGFSSVAIGDNAVGTQNNSVVLGAHSTDRAATKETKGTITLSDGTTRVYGKFAGTNPNGVVSVGAEGKERQIINVAAGKISADSTDAVNGSQLYSLASEVGKNAEDIRNTNREVGRVANGLNRLDVRVNRVGANAAALAALHPLDFDPDDKWDFAAGYGNYKDAHAMAIGAFYQPNGDIMFSVGGSFGGGENMVNAGLSLKLGQGNHVSRARVAVAKDVSELNAKVARLEEQNRQLMDTVSKLVGVSGEHLNVNFPDVPKNHWAYQYVKSLADRGYLQGYPDGEFKGDRPMTRYEYAAVIYRALQNGAPVDADMGRSLGEFGPEIEKVASADRFRVDRIAGKDNDRYKIERVRVNDKDDKAQNDFRDVYGSHIHK